MARHERATAHPVWYVLAVVTLFGILYLLFAQAADFDAAVREVQAGLAVWLPRVIAAILILLIARIIVLVLRRGLRVVEEPRERYVVSKFASYLVWLAALVAVVAVFARDISNVLVAGGLIGFGLTLVLQKPITSFAGWLFLTSRHLFRAGDRIQVGEIRGDVVDIDIMSTTLLEFGGEWVRADQPTGRYVTIPNSMVLEFPVYNYSKGLPYIWDEISFPVAFDGDWKFAREVLLKVADEVIGNETMRKLVSEYRDELKDTPLTFEMSEVPTVHMVQSDSWIELTLRYLVHIRMRRRTKSNLTERVLEEFGKSPDALPAVYRRSQSQILDDRGKPKK
jgi:small-conductance mechanosensitive channel